MDDIQLVKEKINVVDLISEYIPVKKAGINFKASCPFHNEKTASFMISPERQIWHCFGCNKGGDIFKFVMEKDGMEFKETLEFLAQKAGVTLKKTAVKKDSRDRLFEVNLKAQEFYHYILTKHLLGKKALEYLKNRGVTDETIEKFGVGYAPNSWESLTKFLLKRGFTTIEIVSSGLGVASKNGCYDRFRGRITFPLINNKDKVIGFSGRVLYPQEPKYINTPQTVIFDKSQYLFGINLSKGEIRNKKEAILMEGEMDVMMSYQAGIKNVVASKGTALTQGQIELLKKYTDNLNLCFDMDVAGDSASHRGIEMAEQAGMNIKVVEILGGKDAAEAIKSDPKIFEKAVTEAMPIYDYYLSSASKHINLKNPAEIKRVSQELLPIWAKIPDEFVRETYIQKLSSFFKTDEKLIRSAIDKIRKNGPVVKYAEVMVVSRSDDGVLGSKSRRELLEEYLIVLLLHIPSDHNYVPSFPETLFTTERWKQLFVMLVLYLDSISFKGGSFQINEFIQGLPEDLVELVDKLYLSELDGKLSDRTHWQKELDGVVSELKKALIKASLEKLSLEIKNAQEFGKIETLESLSKRFRDLSVKLKNL